MTREQGMALMAYQRDLMRRESRWRSNQRQYRPRGAEFDTAIETIARA